MGMSIIHSFSLKVDVGAAHRGRLDGMQGREKGAQTKKSEIEELSPFRVGRKQTKLMKSEMDHCLALAGVNDL
jgi:hypothetical protein